MNFSLLCFKSCPYNNNSRLISLEDLNVILGGWNGLQKIARKLRSDFFRKLRFLEKRLLVTWLKCLFELIFLQNWKMTPFLLFWKEEWQNQKYRSFMSVKSLYLTVFKMPLKTKVVLSTYSCIVNLLSLHLNSAWKLYRKFKLLTKHPENGSMKSKVSVYHIRG